MHLKSIIAIIAASAIGSAIAGPLPIAIDEDGNAMTFPQARELVARDLEARAEAVQQDVEAAHNAEFIGFPFSSSYHVPNTAGVRYPDGYSINGNGIAVNRGGYQFGLSNYGLFAKGPNGQNYNLNAYTGGTAALYGRYLFGH